MRPLVCLNWMAYCVWMHECVCVCIHVPSPPSLQLFELLAFGIQSFLLFFQMKNMATFICFSYQPCLGGHISTPRIKKGEKNPRQSWYAHLKFFCFSFRVLWGIFGWGQTTDAGAREPPVSGAVFPARWTVRRCRTTWVHDCTLLSSFGIPKKQQAFDVAPLPKGQNITSTPQWLQVRSWTVSEHSFPIAAKPDT